MKGKLKNKRGITLITLVITIIVLIILAGISINLLIGDNGIITRAKDAKVVQEKADLITRIGLDITAKQIQNKGTITQAEVEEILEGYGEVVKANGQIVSVGPTGKDYVIPFSEIYSGELEVEDTPPTPLAIGTTVNYVTSLNNVTLDNWKVFLSDSDYTYLIYGDYLPNAAVSSTIQTTHDLDTNGTYSIYSTNSGADLISAMTTTSNWVELVNNGEINGTALSSTIKNDANVWAMGSPTIDLWVNSWNSKHSSDTLYTRYIDTIDNSNDIYFQGYAISNSTPVASGILDLSNKTGYNDTLYFPYQEGIDDCNGYFMASPAARSGLGIMNVSNSGELNDGCYVNDGMAYAFRPVIKLPTSVVNQ